MDKLEELRNVIKQWNANRLDLFEISEPNKVNFAFAFDIINEGDSWLNISLLNSLVS